VIGLRHAVPLLLAASLSAPALAGDAAPGLELERNNNWTVEITNKPTIQSPLYVTLRQAGQHWEIDGMYDAAPTLARSQKLELLIASRDLQQWSNAYTDRVVNCDSFEAREADFHSVCTSTLAEQQSAGSAVAGILLFGGNAKRPVMYNRDKVTAVIRSIRVGQASAKLDAFEQGKR